MEWKLAAEIGLIATISVLGGPGRTVITDMAHVWVSTPCP